MSTGNVLLVLAGSMLGAPVRYLVDRAVQARHQSGFPWGTWVVNVSGSCLLGFLAAGAVAGVVPQGVMAGAGFGFCGALTTYSTFGYETVRLMETGSWFYAITNMVAGLAAGLGAALAGAAVALALWA